jgi:hypothetical protein
LAFDRDRSNKYRIPFLVERHIVGVIDFDDYAILLVDVSQVLLECSNAVHPHHIPYEGEM